MSRKAEIRLAKGDVEVLRVERDGDGVRLLVYQRPDAVPLIQAILSEDERDSLILALRRRGCRPTGGK